MALSPEHPDRYQDRHIGPRPEDVSEMLAALKLGSLEELVEETVPASIRLDRDLDLPPARSEPRALARLRELGARNRVYKSYLGMGYHDCHTPPVILRNVLENPGWYTAYTPYQAEIAQGRLEALLNYQTMVCDLTGLEVSNASLLDEATAAAEAMTLLHGAAGHPADRAFLVSQACHPQVRSVVETRAWPLGIEVVVADPCRYPWDRRLFGLLLPYPATDGEVVDYRDVIQRAHREGARVAMAADLLSLTLLVPPGELGADVAVGSSQRFGVPLGYGGPHAAFLATRSEHVRRLPGRLIGVSRDSLGHPALRMAIQTREQHIRREKATSNICTAQVLLAVMAGLYAVYHGPRGLKAIAERVHGLARVLAAGLDRLGFPPRHQQFFDTLRVDGTPAQAEAWSRGALARRMNFRRLDEGSVTIALDETTMPQDVEAILDVFAAPTGGPAPRVAELEAEVETEYLGPLARSSEYLTHPVFHRYHSEHEMLRYLKRLENRDLSLTHSMIPLGSCTMKLNGAAEMIPVTWPELGGIHPFVPLDQAQGYRELIGELDAWLRAITGFASVSFQPNAGSQGEYAGLLVIRRYHASRGEWHRDVCLIPASAHGTNPASAAMAGLRVVVVACDERGNVDLADLGRKAEEHRERLGAVMVTYPSTYGVFEEEIRQIVTVVHEHGGQVYMDGANLNAQVGLTSPAAIGADVCHLNLHKTFCIPHGGGGPGMGPIGVREHLAPFLPRHPVIETGGPEGIGAVSAAPWGSPSILPISWAYIAMMGAAGLKRASQVAILNANYVAVRLAPHYPVLYRGSRGRVAHECILDTRGFKESAGVVVEDIAKRLMDYGFHAPTISFPVAGTLMVEPTESESKEELDRFCEAMIAIRGEIRAIEEGRASREANLLKGAPHTAEMIAASDWKRPYTREEAAYPAPWLRQAKFWPSVGRIDNVHGDRHLVCSCPPVSEYGEYQEK